MYCFKCMIILFENNEINVDGCYFYNTFVSVDYKIKNIS